MNALSTAQEIARAVGLPVPATLVTNTNQDASRLWQALNDAGRYLARYEWNSLVAETTISCSASANTYSLPTDFRAIVPMTIWKQGDSVPTAGPVRQVEWQSIKYGTSASGIVDRFHLRYVSTNQRILISPLPAGGEHFVYLYRSANWVVQVLGGPHIDAIASDSDTFLIDGFLLSQEAKWRFLRAIGQPYGDEKNEAMELRQQTLADDGGMEVIDGSDGGYASGPYFIIPDRDYQL